MTRIYWDGTLQGRRTMWDYLHVFSVEHHIDFTSTGRDGVIEFTATPRSSLGEWYRSVHVRLEAGDDLNMTALFKGLPAPHIQYTE